MIVSRRDLTALYAKLPLLNEPDMTKSMFVSDLFGLWPDPPLSIEFMAGLKVMVAGRWYPVQPKTRQLIAFGEHQLYTPEKGEMIRILCQFGREKDKRHAATLASD